MAPHGSSIGQVTKDAMLDEIRMKMDTGGAFTNRYKRDVTRKHRARNNARKRHARANHRSDSDSSSVYEPMAAEESVPVVFTHYLEQLHAASVALPLLTSMWETPRIFLAALHGIAEHSSQDEESDEESEEESWESVLSKPWPSGQGVYANLVESLFLEPFKARDAFEVQEIILEKLVKDMKHFKKSVLPYVKYRGKILKQVSDEVDRVLRFVDMNRRHFEDTSVLYPWQTELRPLEKATEDALHINSVTEFAYNGSTLTKDEFEELSDEADHLNKWPDLKLFTPEDAGGILKCELSDLNYEEILKRSSPEDALKAELAVSELFAHGTNYKLTLENQIKCKANVRKLEAMTPEVAHRCYVALDMDDMSAEADANIAEFKKLLASEIPGVSEIGVEAIGEVDSVNVISVTLEFGGSGEAQDLFTYVTVPFADEGPLATGGDDQPVNLLSVRKKGPGETQEMDLSYLVAEVLDGIADAS